VTQDKKPMRKNAVEFKISSCPKTFFLDGSHRGVDPKITRSRLHECAGFDSILLKKEMLLVEDVGMPVYFLEAKLVPGSDRGYEAAGKGFTDNQSYCSAGMEVIERRCCSLHKNDDLYTKAYSEMRAEAVDPESLGLFRSGPYTSNLAIDWVAAWNITKSARAFVPALHGLYVSRAFKHWYFDSSEEKTRITLSDSNGCAAGNTIEEAIAHGIYELVERDAVTIRARNRLASPDVNPPRSTSNPHLSKIVEALQGDDNFIVRIKLLTLDIPVPVFGVLMYDRRLESMAIGYGAHIDPTIALLRAISEMYQARGILQRKHGSLKTCEHFPAKKLSSASYLWDHGEHTVDFESIEDASAPDIKKDIELLVRRLSDCGLDVLVVNRIHEEFNFPVVKIVIPSLQRVDWAWLYGHELLARGSNRIFSVPAELELVEKIRSLEQLKADQIVF
jgi:thiazole/oxazole-forming peptide maturase SagD family component